MPRHVLAAPEGLCRAAGAIGEAIRLKPNESAFHDYLGHVYFDQRRYALAIPHYREAVRLKPADPALVDHLANALFASGDKPGCIKLLREAILRNPNATLLHQNLSAHLARIGQDDEAIEEGKKAVKLGPRLTSTHLTLAIALRKKDRLDEAIVELRRAIELNPRDPVLHAQLGQTFYNKGRYAKALTSYIAMVLLVPNNAAAQETLGNTLNALQLYHEAEAAYRRAINLEPNNLRYQADLAVLYQTSGRAAEAVRRFKLLLQQSQDRNGVNHPETLLMMSHLGVACREAGQLKEAIPQLETALERGRKCPGGLPVSLAWLPGALAETYERDGQLAKAEAIHRDLLKQAQQQFSAKDPRTAAVLVQLGDNLLKQKKFTAAEPLLRDCLKVREAKLPDDWTTFNARLALGEALAGQKKYADAEPLLLEGYNGMKERQDKMPLLVRSIRLTAALQRLVRLYEATNQKEKAADWRKKLEEAKAAQQKSKP